MRATVMRGGQATAKTRWPDSLERWLVQHPDRVALGVLALGVLVRLAFALLTYLNPDEIMRVLAADRASLADVYRHDIENPHPPLLSLLLFFWRFLGRSDLLLRLLPVLAGGATLWFSYRWLKSAFDARTGLVALLLLAFSPSMVVIGFEIRPYAVELTAVAVALFALERGLREAKPGYILLFCLAQSLAICSHYSALLFVLAAGVFVLAGLMARRLPRRVALAWIAGQLFTVGVLALLYVVHISRLIGGQRETVLREEYLRNLYFSPGADSLVGFLATRLLDLFRYVGAARQGGLAMLPLAAFAGGIGLLLFRRPRQVWNALFMALPFVAAAVVAALGLYPFGGTRHLSFLILFGVAGASVTVAALTGRRLWPLLAAALVLMPLWELFGGWMMMGGYVKPGVYRRSRIAAAVKYVREVTPLGGIVFSDLQTQLMLKRYLWNGRGEAEATYPEGMYGFRTTGYHLVGLRDWRFVSPRFGDDFSRLVETYGVVPGTPVTVVSSEWFYPHLADELKLQGTEYPGTRTFGPRISVFTAVAGTQVVGESTAAAVSRRRGVLD
ncbi:glycosyltransferase family 39 protein, partial [candidate division WOR-3 bacterium]|nr:glycosyltransferase family 39 protein [candidate division WOR-3 bacterium]